MLGGTGRGSGRNPPHSSSLRVAFRRAPEARQTHVLVCARVRERSATCAVREQGWAPLGGHGAHLRLSRCPSHRPRGCGAPRDGCRAGPGGPLRSLMWLSPLLFLCPGRIWDSDSYLNRSATTPPLVRFTQKASIRTSCFTAPSTRSSSSGARAWRLSPRAPSRWSCSSECGGRARQKRTLLLPGWGVSQPFPVQPFPTAATPLRGSSPDPSRDECSSHASVLRAPCDRGPSCRCWCRLSPSVGASSHRCPHTRFRRAWAGGRGP